ncbi:hypothetical protein [Nocardia arthritidis]|uniref:hypothetical protein n=1 Tax=Nocardia arthritidis TaxID=228602 RepID=UPI0012EDF35E|nr:hypothetical protein [Nocardia arthritidis]
MMRPRTRRAVQGGADASEWKSRARGRSQEEAAARQRARAEEAAHDYEPQRETELIAR